MKTRRKKANSSTEAQGTHKPVATAGKRRKNRFSAEELEKFRQSLLRKRRQLIGDVSRLCNEVTHRGIAGEECASSSMPIHMAELASDTAEQECATSLVENEQELLREVDDALQRIRDKTYGICCAMKKPIPKARLKAIPWARYCIEYARKLESGQA